MFLRGWKPVLSVSALALVMTRCAGGGGPAPAGAPGEAPKGAAAAARFASAADVETALLELEDRRAFDAGILTGATSFGEPAVRARAAVAIGRIGADRGLPLVRPLLADRSPEVRAAAAFGYQLLGNPTSTPDLLPLLSDSDPSVAAAAARAAGALARGDGEDALIAAIPKAASPEPRAAMLQSLWRFADSASAAAAAPFASDADPKVRAAAIYALSRKPIESSQAVLTSALAAPDADSAAMAARGLGILGKKESIAPLGAALDSGKTPLVINALTALEAVLEKNPGTGVADDRKARILALAGDANANLAVPALVLLRQFEATDREIRSRLWSIALTGEGRRRQIALVSVIAALRERGKEALERASQAPEPAIRAAAAEAAAYLPQPAARPYRQKLAADKEVVVRLAVLTNLKGAEAVRENRDIVNAALTDPDPGVRAAAVEALGQINDASILPLVSDALTRSAADKSPDVAIAAIGVAEKFRGEPAARAIVDAAYKSPGTLVARLARRSLLFAFRADRASLPAAEYRTGRSAADYAAILAEARKPLTARVETARGEFVIRFAGRDAPMTVANFVKLARAKYFDGVPIHRVVPNFVIQDGDPTGTGNGGPGYEIRDELNPLPYDRGTVGMALSGPDTGGSQWFVTHSPQPHLNALYTVFGQIASGQDVVDRIEQGDRITRITVVE